jgi:hypothetical protein
MSTSCRSEPTATDVAAVARDLADASLVRLVPRPDGDAVAATGVLARALDHRSVPYQITPALTRQARRESIGRGDDATLSVALGPLTAADCSLGAGDGTLSSVAARVADELGAEVPSVLALAGAVAAGAVPGGDDTAWLLDHENGPERSPRPGVGVPTGDLVDGLAHTLLCHADWSGSPEATAAALDALSVDGDPRQAATLDEDDHRTIASLVSIDATDTARPERAATTIGRVLRPYVTPEGPFETLGGYADVLDAVSRAQPGVAAALAVGGDCRESALAAWRAHASKAHDGLRAASIGRYDGYVVARVDGAPVVSTAQLCRDVAAPEPLAVAVDADAVGLAARPETDAIRPTEALAEALDGAVTATARYGFVTTDGTAVDERTVIDTLREVR